MSEINHILALDILLIGYGKMGKAIEKAAIQRGHRISGIVTSHNPGDLQQLLQQSTVAIEFTRPEVCIDNIKACFDASVPVVIGTTGWYKDYEEIARICRNREQAMLSSTNFSIGVNIFFALNRWLAAVMGKQPEYTAQIEEIHHTQKLDAPSGTAISIAEGILDKNPELKGWEGFMNTYLPGAAPEKLPVISRREDKVPGTHIVTYKSHIDEIEIKHTAHNREGFATGSVLAAEFLAGKKGVFTMNDVLQFNTNQK